MAPLPSLPRKYKAVVLVGVAALIVVGVSAVQGGRGWDDLRQLEAKQRELEALAFQLEQKNQHLRDHLRRLEQDDVYLEKLARERLGWVKPGEVVFRVRGMVKLQPWSSEPENEDGALWAAESPGTFDPADP